MSATWKQIAGDKRARIEASIPAEWRLNTSQVAADSFLQIPHQCGILSEQELRITETSATKLVENMASGCLKSVDVTLAFCKRAAVAHQLVNCAMDFFWQEALARAKELDEYRQTTGKVIGPLHGLPISLTDQFHIKGYETCMGYVSRVGKYEKEDSLMVTILRNAGAILYIKTSVPQGLVTCETENNIIGRTLNSHNAKWTCGGTSGGEGALVGLYGSPLGIGTDYVDIAAGFNSLYGLRPSHGRLPCANMAMSMEGHETVHTVCGPMAHSVQDLRLLVKSTLDSKPWAYDSKLLPLKWNQAEEDDILAKICSGTLVFAFYDWDKVVMPHPPVLRAMKKAAAVMKQKHTVIEWPPYKHDVGYDLMSKVERLDGYADIRRHINASGEPLVHQVEELMRSVPKEADINTIWDIQMQKWRYTSSYIQQGQTMGDSLGKVLDVLVAPIAPTAATFHNQSRYNGYASVLNLNDLPSVTVPVLLADKNIDVKREGYQPVNDLDAMVQADYDPEAYHGSPVAIQVIGRKLSEEVILAVAEEMGRLLRAAGSEITGVV